MKTAVGQNAQPECDSLRNSQPMELRSNGDMRSDRLAEKTKRAAHSRQTAAGLAVGRGYHIENRVAVVHLADNQCTNQGQQGVS